LKKSGLEFNDSTIALSFIADDAPFYTGIRNMMRRNCVSTGSEMHEEKLAAVVRIFSLVEFKHNNDRIAYRLMR
jgi:hypothetical protein